MRLICSRIERAGVLSTSWWLNRLAHHGGRGAGHILLWRIQSWRHIDPPPPTSHTARPFYRCTSLRKRNDENVFQAATKKIMVIILVFISSFAYAKVDHGIFYAIVKRVRNRFIENSRYRPEGEQYEVQYKYERRKSECRSMTEEIICVKQLELP